MSCSLNVCQSSPMAITTWRPFVAVVAATKVDEAPNPCSRVVVLL